MPSLSLLQRSRLNYQPLLPHSLHDLTRLIPVSESFQKTNPVSGMEELFPHSLQLPAIHLTAGDPSPAKPLKVGIVLSGGPAPGGHTVISGLFDALKKLHPESQLIGFLNGPEGVIKNQFIELTEESIAHYRNQGGFDCIGTGRGKIETPEQFTSAKNTLLDNRLDGLVIVGGDDSNTNAAFLAEFCLQKGIPTKIIGVPKTIDGDLKNAYIEVSFGFDTASKIYSEIIGNLAQDALSQKKYYFFVKMMGRSASHLTLECALQTQINLALIGEEIAERKETLAEVANQIADLICSRAEKGKNYGVILVPEGLIEFIPECQSLIEELNHLLHENLLLDCPADPEVKLNSIMEQLTLESKKCLAYFPREIQAQLLLERDPHGNIQLSKIETERVLIALVNQELMLRRSQGNYKGQFNPQPLFCGYEGRSGLPTNFDCQYCYALGHLAALLIRHGASGYMCSISNLKQPVESWEIKGIPIVKMLHFEVRKGKRQAVLEKAVVNLEGAAFKEFKKNREGWRIEDMFCCPGPIQFKGPLSLTDQPPLSL